MNCGLSILGLALVGASFVRSDHEEGSHELDHPVGGPSLWQCPVNEYQFWGSHEEGCDGLIAITPGSCICGQGLYRRETDRLCVRKSECPPRCPPNEEQFFGVAEEGCNGNFPIHPGDCICKPGYKRREADRTCVTSCGRRPNDVVFTVPGSCGSANQLCKANCPPDSTFTFTCQNTRAGRNSVVCTCRTWI